MKKNVIVALHPKAHPNLKIITALEPVIISASLGERLSIAHHIEQEAHGLPAAVCFFEFINQKHAEVELVIALPNQGKSNNHTRALVQGGAVADYFFPQQVTVVFFEGELPGAFYQSLRDQRAARQMILHQWVDGSEPAVQNFTAIDTHYCAVRPTQQPAFAAAKQGEESRQVWCDLRAALGTHEAKWLQRERSKSTGAPPQSWGLPTLLWATPLLFAATYCLLWGPLFSPKAEAGRAFSL